MKWTILDGDYYISPTCGNDGWTGTKDKPFKTLQKALAYDVVSNGNVAGRKFVMEGGVEYTQSFAYSGRTYKRFVVDGDKALYRQTPSLGIHNDECSNFIFLPKINETEIIIPAQLAGSSSTWWYYLDCLFINSRFGQVGVRTFKYDIIYSKKTAVNGNVNVIFSNAVAKAAGSYNGTSPHTFFSSYFDSISGVVNLNGYSACPAGVTTMTGTNKYVEIAAAGFVDYANNNFNILEGSPLQLASVDPATGKPTHIGGGKLVKSFNGSSLTGTHAGTEFDATDKSLILSTGTQVSEYVSNVIDVGESRVVSMLDFTKLSELHSSEYKPQKFIGYNNMYFRGQVVSGDTIASNTLQLPAQFVSTVFDDWGNISGQDTFIRLVLGTNAFVTKNVNTTAVIGATTLLISNTSGLMVDRAISASNAGIPSGAVITAINPNVSITISNALTIAVSSAVTLSIEQKYAITDYNTATRTLTIDGTWGNTPIVADTVFEIFKSPNNYQDFEIRWGDASDLSSKPWCRMVLGQPMGYSMYLGNKVGNADVNYDPAVWFKTKFRYCQYRIRMRKLVL